MFSDVLILAGGFGERLWPASSPSFPKQFMSLEGGVSFLQSSILRALELNIKGKILIVTRKDIENTALEQCAMLCNQLDEEKQNKISNDLIVIAEPTPIHTAAPVTLVCHLLNKIEPQKEHTLLVMTSDHVIGPVDFFVQDTKIAYEVALKDKIVCYAIIPTEPATGYGYIKMGSSITNDDNIPIETVYKIDQFKEKPDLETAKKYLETGLYAWNSGMFGFKTNTYLSELKICEPESYNAFIDINNAEPPKFTKKQNINLLKNWEAMNDAYGKAPKISIDKALAEKTKHAWAVKTTFSWEDIGSWDSFEKLFTQNSGVTSEINTDNCFVYSDLPVALCGVKDLIVVAKNDKILVMKKGFSNTVKDAVHKLENE